MRHVVCQGLAMPWPLLPAFHLRLTPTLSPLQASGTAVAPFVTLRHLAHGLASHRLSCLPQPQLGAVVGGACRVCSALLSL